MKNKNKYYTFRPFQNKWYRSSDIPLEYDMNNIILCILQDPEGDIF